jgi:hypothetical protein
MLGAAALLAVAALSASPERVTLTGSAAAPLELTNHGAAPLVVEARPGGVVLDLRGRPRLVSGAVAARWLSVTPRQVSLAPGATARVEVASSPPRQARPGDHHAVVLLTTRPLRGAAVAVRMRLGVRVVVRIPGRLVRRLELGGVSVRRRGILDVSVANRGNVTERLRLAMTLLRRGRRVAVLRAVAQELLPRTRALVGLRHPRRLRGRVTAVVELEGPVPIRRVFRLRL